MKKFIFLLFILLVGTLGTGLFLVKKYNTGAPPYDTDFSDLEIYDPLAYLKDWKRPDGPPKVGLQVGHYKNSELPEELENLIGNTGATGAGMSEAEVNLRIAEETKKILEDQGVQVEILPATVPENYWGDVFVAIHADGNLNRSTNGFKVASPRRDYSGNSDELADFIEVEYQKATNLVLDPNVSRNMKGYYAFNYRRYKHAIHPMTAATILETGFLTNAQDRKIIVDNPKISATGLSEGIIKYFKWQKLLQD